MVGVEVQAAPAAGGKKQKMSKNAFRRQKKREVSNCDEIEILKSILIEIQRSETPAASETAPSPSTVKASPEPIPEPQATETNSGGAVKPLAVTEDDEFEEFMPPSDDPMFAQFKSIFAKFNSAPGGTNTDEAIASKPDIYDEEDYIPDEDDETAQPKRSKKAKKMASRLSVAELKALVQKPDMVVEADTTSTDPLMLLAIKSHRNVVPVPQHWSLKREYLSSKRGIEKAAFALPKFIQETGIAEMRDAVLEKQAEASLKQRQRERVQPKMGKLDIDYQKLHDAFFKFQTKPELTRYGEVYYEGKEYETNLRHLRPGDLSEELKEALSIPVRAPPPWLANMQRFGPPPSYPTLKIPGLNAPLPLGAEWGWHVGGWGKAPIDQFGEPLWGGQLHPKSQEQLEQEEMEQNLGEPVEKTLWGELQPAEESEEESEEEADEDENDEDEDDKEVAAGTATASGFTTRTGLASAVPTDYGGTETEEFTLRKQRPGTQTEESPRETARRSAYTVVPESQAKMSGFFGSDRAYDIKAAEAARHLPVLGEDSDRSRKRKAGDVDVAVDIDALERDDRLSKEEIARQYEQSEDRRSAANPWGSSNKVDQDDLSNMIAEESRKRMKKDEERRSSRR